MEKVDIRDTALDLASDARQNVSKVAAMLSAAIYLMQKDVPLTPNSDRVNYVDWMVDMRDRLEVAGETLLDMKYFIHDNLTFPG